MLNITETIGYLCSVKLVKFILISFHNRRKSVSNTKSISVQTCFKTDPNICNVQVKLNIS